jgi:hypothetical protein
MAHEPLKIMGAGCVGGLFGAFLGVVIGVSIGPVFTAKPEHMVEVREGIKVNVNAFSEFPGMFLGAGIGGVIGGIGGSVLGAGLAAKVSSRPTEQRPSVKVYRPGMVPERATESPDVDLARLNERASKFEAKKPKDDRFSDELLGG